MHHRLLKRSRPKGQTHGEAAHICYSFSEAHRHTGAVRTERHIYTLRTERHTYTLRTERHTDTVRTIVRPLLPEEWAFRTNRAAKLGQCFAAGRSMPPFVHAPTSFRGSGCARVHVRMPVIAHHRTPLSPHNPGHLGWRPACPASRRPHAAHQAHLLARRAPRSAS